MSGITSGGASNFSTLQLLQRIQTTTTTATSTNSTSFVDTNSTVSITPKLNTSHILIKVSGVLDITNTSFQASATIARNGTDLMSGTAQGGAAVGPGTTSPVPVHMQFDDTPATTSATTYTVRIRTSNGSASAVWLNPCTAVMIVEEWAI